MKNLCLNGGMKIAQANEGTALQLPVYGGKHACDGWNGLLYSKTAKAFVQRVPDAPPGLTHSVMVYVEKPGTGIEHDDCLVINSMIPAENTKELDYGTPEAKVSSVSFKAKSSIPGLFGFNVANKDGTRTLVRTFEIPKANEWIDFTFENIPGCTDGVWPGGSKLWGYLVFFACCAPKWQTATPDTWLEGDYGSTAKQTNLHLLTAGSSFQIAAVSHVIGPKASAYREDKNELKRCQRRYEKSYPQGIAPGSIHPESHQCRFTKQLSDRVEIGHSFAVEKAAKPVMTLYSPTTGVASMVRDEHAGKDIPATILSANSRGFEFAVPGARGCMDLRWHWTADCRQGITDNA